MFNPLKQGGFRNMNHSIYLRKTGKLIVHPGQSRLPESSLATAMKNVESLGYTFSKELMEVFRTLSKGEFTAVYTALVKELRNIVGAHVSYKPMYPQFPDQVMEEDDIELYINAILHYLTLALPAGEAKPRLPLLDRVDLKVIGLGDEADFARLIRQLIQANGSISDSDKEGIEWAIAHTEEIGDILPEEIPSKENVGFVVGALLKHDRISMDLIGRYFKTATDVLRLAAAMSEGDVSLAAPTRFRAFKRPERRLLLGLLEGCGNMTEDMLRYKERWIRLGERLHPAEYKQRFFRCREAFDILRNDLPYQTFNSKVELALLSGDVWEAMGLLESRPGEFARRLDHLLRLSGEASDIVEFFRLKAGDVSTPVLLQVMAHFTHRNDGQQLRTFFPKGNVGKAVAVKNLLPKLDASVCEELTAICREGLVHRFAGLPPLGKVYLDERLKHHLVPYSQRSASKSLRTLVRGSRIELPKGNVIRFFTWWKEGEVGGQPTGRVDIDLSAVMYDTDWKYMGHISYTNLRSANYRAVHSGDITAAPNGACEFIDIDIPSVLKYGGRYVVASLNSFTSQPYCDLPECFAGWMMRKNPGSGEIFEPATVVDKVDLAADTQIDIPVILDLKERMVIWTDIALTRQPHFLNNVEGNQSGMVLMGKAMTSLQKANLYELFMLHAQARGELVETPAEADTVYSLQKGITPFDTATIMAEYMQ
jgi:hypothetical protein